jgi:hypothetical protein
MRRTISDEQIAIALCCGKKCTAGTDAPCHKADFASEVKRIRDLLNYAARYEATSDYQSESA